MHAELKWQGPLSGCGIFARLNMFELSACRNCTPASAWVLPHSVQADNRSSVMDNACVPHNVRNACSLHVVGFCHAQGLCVRFVLL